MSSDAVTAESAAAHELTRGRLIARNTLWNLAGRCLPLAAAVLSIPRLFHALGTDRFGILTLALAFIGYFGLLDFGLGRALTQAISEKIGRNLAHEVPGLIWTACSLLAALSAVAMALCLTLTPVIIRDVLKTPAGIADETISAFYVLGLSIPFVVGSAALWGVLAAYQRFDLGNRINIPVGMASFVGPAIVVHWCDSLVAVMTVLLFVRAAATVALAAMCLRIVPDLRRDIGFVRREVRRLTSFGGWLTVSSVIAPLMASIDRFIIGALVSITAVGYYGTTYDMVTKLWILPVGLLGAVGPALTVSMTSNRGGNTVRLFERAAKYLFFALFAAAIVLVAFAHIGLTLWLGRDFADKAAPVAQWLAAGVFVNCLSWLPTVTLASHGRPDLAAKLQFIEIVCYLPLLYAGIRFDGIDGAAEASALRMVVEAVALFLIVARYLPALRSASMRLLAAVPPAMAMLLIGGLLASIAAKLAFVAAVLALLVAIGWFLLIDEAERDYLLTQLRRLRVLRPVRPV